MTQDGRRRRYRPAHRSTGDDDVLVMEAVAMAGELLTRITWIPATTGVPEALDLTGGLGPDDLARRCRTARRLTGVDDRGRTVLSIERDPALTVVLVLDADQRAALEERLGGVPGDEALIPVEDWESDRRSRGWRLALACLTLAFAVDDLGKAWPQLHPDRWTLATLKPWGWLLICAGAVLTLAHEVLAGLRRAARRRLARLRWRRGTARSEVPQEINQGVGSLAHEGVDDAGLDEGGPGDD